MLYARQEVESFVASLSRGQTQPLLAPTGDSCSFKEAAGCLGSDLALVRAMIAGRLMPSAIAGRGRVAGLCFARGDVSQCAPVPEPPTATGGQNSRRGRRRASEAA